MKIAIIGEGIGGLCSAVTLQALGHEIQVYEAVAIPTCRCWSRRRF